MNAESPPVSIITPVFNRAHLIAHTIDSVIAQSYEHWELLLVDDGSTDGIEEFISAQYAAEPRIRFFNRDREPKSASTCRNIGGERSNGKYLIFLDSDDLLEPYCLEQRVAVMEAERQLDFAVFPLRYLSHDGQKLPNSFDNGKDPLLNFLSGNSYWCIMSPIWRRHFFEGIGGFNAAFSRYQDPEIHIRALTTPGVSYEMCMGHQPDTLLIPSVKKPSVAFAVDVANSLELLLPQTFQCLKTAGKEDWMKFMKGYLIEWLKTFAYTNFNDLVSMRTTSILDLFQRYNVATHDEIKREKAKIRAAEFLAKVVRKLYLMALR